MGKGGGGGGETADCYDYVMPSTLLSSFVDYQLTGRHQVESLNANCCLETLKKLFTFLNGHHVINKFDHV